MSSGEVSHERAVAESVRDALLTFNAAIVKATENGMSVELVNENHGSVLKVRITKEL